LGQSALEGLVLVLKADNQEGRLYVNNWSSVGCLSGKQVKSIGLRVQPKLFEIGVGCQE
jgi:hypothetical protein